MPWKNKEDRKNYNKKYRLEHKEELKEYQKKWKFENRQKVNENARRWRLENIEIQRPKDNIRILRWRHKNPEKHKESVKQRKLRTVMYLWDYKEQRGCSQCPEKDPRCLDFHHRNPEEKSFAISHGLSNKLSIQALMKEIEKCDLLCRNCHIKLNKRVYVKK